MLNSVKNEVERIVNSKISWDKLNNKTILITGATGFIGSYIVRALLEKTQLHVKVLALVIDYDQAQILFAKYIENGRMELIVGDICDKLTIEKRADFVIHCASNAAPKEYSLYPVETMKINFLGTLNMLDYAKRVGVEGFLYLSTIEVYGKTTSEEHIDEKTYGVIDALNPRSCYPLSKKACETLCISYSEEYGVPIKIGRLSYVFGPGMRRDDSKIVSVFPECVARGRDIVLKSRGEQKRSYTYISDAVVGLLKVLLDGQSGQVYNIASRHCVTTIAQIANTLVELYPQKKLKVEFNLPDEQELKAFSPIENAVLDSAKLESLGWSPKIDLITGLKNVVEERIEMVEKEQC